MVDAMRCHVTAVAQEVMLLQELARQVLTLTAAPIRLLRSLSLLPENANLLAVPALGTRRVEN